MHKRFLSSIGRRPSRLTLPGFSCEPRIAANRQQGQESEKAIPDGDSPEASVSRGVVSFVSIVNEGSRHANISKRLFCESGGPNNQVRPCSLYATVRLLTLQ